MKSIFKKMPYLKALIVLVGYLTFTAQTTPSYSCGNATSNPPVIGTTVGSYPSTVAAGLLPELRVEVSNESFNNDECGKPQYFDPTLLGVYAQIYQNDVKIGYDIKMDLVSKSFPASGVFSTKNLSIGVAGTYEIRIMAADEGYPRVIIKTVVKPLTVSEGPLKVGTYVLTDFTYTSRTGDTTYTFSSNHTIDASKNYIRFLDGAKADAQLNLNFTPQEKANYHWLDKNIEYNHNGNSYGYSLTNAANVYNFFINYQGNRVDFKGGFVSNPDRIQLYWGRGTTGPSYFLYYQRQ